jgi:hypothetical protein
MRLFRLLALALLSVSTAAQAASEPRYYNDKDGNKAIWQESGTELPAFPQRANLIPLVAPEQSQGNEYFIDASSLLLGTDAVMRFTVVIVSPSGAVNVLHQGLACEPEVIKTYGYGTSTGIMVQRSQPSWRPIIRDGVMGYQFVLMDRYLCDETRRSTTVANALTRLRDPDAHDDAIDGSDVDNVDS